MPRRMPEGRPWIVRLLAVALGLLPVVGLATEPPPLVFEAPARFAPLAGHLQKLNPQAVRAAMELVGLQEPGPPIAITLEPEDAEIARRAPSWVSGFTLVPSGRIVLFPDRQIFYPHGSFEGLLLHELSHVFVMRVTRGQPVPRWFDEGVATVASSERDPEDWAWGFWMALTATPISLEELNRLFGENPPSAQKAYLVAETMVRYLMRSQGADIPRRILRARADGVSFNEAVQTVTGRSLLELEREFWVQQTGWWRWVPVLTSSPILWAAIVLLAWVAWRKQRQRTAALKRRWEQLEQEDEKP